MSSLAKKGLGTPVLKNDRLKNAVKRSNLLKRVEEIQRIVEPIELTLDALLGNENNNDDATLLGNLQNLQPSTKIVKNSKQPQKVCQPLQKKRADKENDIPETKASLNTLVTRPVPIPIRPGQDEKAMLNAVYQSMVYTDVTFMVEEQEFPAHRGILAARCRYFEKLFTSSQGKGDRIQFTELSAKAFPILIKFIYGQEIELTEDTALELINITDKYCLPLLSKKLEEFLNASLAKDNIVRFTKMAEVMKNVRLKTLVLAFARKNLGSLAQNGDILRVIKHI